MNRRHFLFTAHARRKLCTVAAAAEQRAAATLLELSTVTEAHAAAVRACALLELEAEALHTQLRKRNGTPACRGQCAAVESHAAAMGSSARVSCLLRLRLRACLCEACCLLTWYAVAD